jgi:hypothetical protein
MSMQFVTGKACFRIRQTISTADDGVTSLKDEFIDEMKDNLLDEGQCSDHGEDFPFIATLVCPKTVPPSRSSVVGNFGLEKVPSLCHIQPFYGDLTDFNAKPHVFAGIANRVRGGGVHGFAHFESEFVQSGPPKITCLWSTLVPVRPPPRTLDLAANGLSTGEVLTSGQSAGRRTAIDSAGREVYFAAISRGEHENGTPLTMLEGPAFDDKIHRLRRRVETCKPNIDDSQTSGDSDREDLSGPLSTRVACDIHNPRTQESDRPLSPKYDDSSFFPETPCRSRKRATGSFDLDSPIHHAKAKGVALDVGKVPNSLMSRADHQNLTVTLIEVRTTFASAAAGMASASATVHSREDMY